MQLQAHSSVRDNISTTRISIPNGRDDSAGRGQCEHVGGTSIGPRRRAAPGRASISVSSSSPSAWGCRSSRQPVSRRWSRPCSSSSAATRRLRRPPFSLRQLNSRHRVAGRARSRRRRWRRWKQDGSAAASGGAAGQGQDLRFRSRNRRRSSRRSRKQTEPNPVEQLTIPAKLLAVGGEFSAGHHRSGAAFADAVPGIGSRWRRGHGRWFRHRAGLGIGLGTRIGWRHWRRRLPAG